MIELTEGGLLTVTKAGRRVVIQKVSAQDGVQALMAMGHTIDCARVFAYSGGDRRKVVALAVRKHLIKKEDTHANL